MSSKAQHQKLQEYVPETTQVVQNSHPQLHLYEEMLNEEKRIFGRKYPPRTNQPSMFEMLKWEAPHQQKCDFKADKLPETQVDQYKVLINKSSNPFQSEQRDNYRQFYHDKQEKVLIPEVDPEVIEKLVEHDQTKPHKYTYPSEAQQQQLQAWQHLHHHGPKTDYQREYGVEVVRDSNDLINVVQRNHEQKSKLSKLLLEEAQLKKREQIKPNELYEKEEPIVINKENNENAGDRESQQTLGKNKQSKQVKGQEKVKSFKGVDTKNVKSKLIKYKPQAVKLDPEYQKERIERRKERIQKMEETTRWLPNTAFTTYFGKPAFENYGRANVHPPVGGCVYGQYLLSHNVNPHRGFKQPEFIQSYNNALTFGERLPESEPQPPRNVKEDFRLSQNQVEELKTRNPLTATKNNRENLHIQKPDLINSLRFASNENSPVNIAENEEERRKRIQKDLKALKEGTRAHTHTDKSFAESQGDHGKDGETQIAKQVRIQENQRARKEEQEEEYTQEQQDARREWAQDLPQNKYMEEMLQKKMKKNRLALKVTEVVPVIPVEERKIIAGISSVKKNEFSPQKKLPSSKEFVTEPIELSDLPHQAIAQLEEKLHNPKLYKNAPAQYTRHIPFAGKPANEHEDIKSVFHYNHSEDPAYYC